MQNRSAAHARSTVATRGSREASPLGAARLGTLVVGALLLAATCAVAQAPDGIAAGPYRSLTFTAAAARPGSSGRLDEGWGPGSGVMVSLLTPFHVGAVGGSVASWRYAPRIDGRPAFRAYVVSLDWRLPLPGPRAVRPSVTLSAGDFATTFDTVSTYGLAKESEIFVGGALDLGIPLRGATRLALSGSAIQVMTSTPIRIFYGTVGLAHTVAAPRWVRRVLE